ncbi:MAG: peptide chain release factor N(5)-glutamine methyltransferase [Bacteroidales bacterium]|nr:peptide chain release factor N(5)-glutamine methyltransferase [Bacteroidales bacterium]
MQYRSNLLKEIKAEFLAQLTTLYEQNEANTLINMLIEHHLGLSQTGMALNPDLRISESEILKLHFAFKRLMNEEPIQYVLGEATFFGLTFHVNPAVLIPRQETESLILLILEHVENKGNVLDIGTGSGCIAISLKSQLANVNVMAIDISEEAIKVAQINSKNLNLDVTFVQDDIFKPSFIDGKYDIIVSNPPYVTNSEKQLMNNNVLLWEPQLALYVSDDSPLIYYNRIAVFSQEHLNQNGLLFFEINEKFGDLTKQLLEETGFDEVSIHKDLNGKDRFIKARVRTKN